MEERLRVRAILTAERSGPDVLAELETDNGVVAVTLEADDALRAGLKLLSAAGSDADGNPQAHLTPSSMVIERDEAGRGAMVFDFQGAKLRLALSDEDDRLVGLVAELVELGWPVGQISSS